MDQTATFRCHWVVTTTQPFTLVFLGTRDKNEIKNSGRKQSYVLLPNLNQRALGTSSFMLWLKFVLIYWTRVKYRYSWIQFMWTFKTYRINFILFLGSCVMRKLVHSSWWELEKSLFGLEVGWAEVIRQTETFLLVCVFVGRRVGWVGIIRHWMLLKQQSISNPHLSRSFALLWNIPCPFLDIFCF